VRKALFKTDQNDSMLGFDEEVDEMWKQESAIRRQAICD